MSLLSTIVIMVCDVVIVLCFVLLALRYRKLEKRVFSLRVSLNDFVHDLFDLLDSVSRGKREIDFLRSDVRSLGERFGILESSHSALYSYVNRITFKKSLKNGKDK